jgi:hypothetical protein
MVKPQLYALAGRLLQMNREMTVHLLRVQSGFFASRNADQAQKMISDMQETLCDLQKVLDAPPSPYPRPSATSIPLK